MKRPDKRVQLSWALYTVVLAVIPAGLSAALFYLSFLPRWIPITLLVLCGIAVLILLTLYFPLRYRRARYQVDDTAITVISGVWFKSRHTMPLTGLRHITVIQGPLEHLFGLAFVVFSAAGGLTVLEGVPIADAEEWSRQLMKGDTP